MGKGEQRLIDASTGGRDINGKEIFEKDVLKVDGCSTLYIVQFDKENLRYIALSDDGCMLLGSSFNKSKIERLGHA